MCVWWGLGVHDGGAETWRQLAVHRRQTHIMLKLILEICPPAERVLRMATA